MSITKKLRMMKSDAEEYRNLNTRLSYYESNALEVVSKSYNITKSKLVRTVLNDFISDELERLIEDGEVILTDDLKTYLETKGE